MIRILFASFCILVLLGASGPSAMPAPIQQAKGPAEICIASWKWYVDDNGTPRDASDDRAYWGTPWPKNTLGALDLRTIPQMATPGPLALGYGLFVLDTAGLCTGLGVLAALSPDLDDGLAKLETRALEIGLGLLDGSLSSATLREVLWELFTADADPTGQTGPKPLRGSLKAPATLILGGYGEIKSETFGGVHLSNAEALFRADFDRLLKAGTSQETLRRWAGATMQELYGSMSDANADRLMETQYRSIGWEPPQTTFTDTFTDADNTHLESHTLDTGQAWARITGLPGAETAHIVSNQMLADSADGGGNRDYYVTTALSDDDNYAQLDLVSGGVGTSDDLDLFVRGNGVAATWDSYGIRFSIFNGSGEFIKVVDNVVTSLLAMSPNPNVGAGDTLKGEAQGSTLSAYIDGALHDSTTDSSITAGMHVGFRSGDFGTVGDTVFDNFEAADLAAPAAERRVIFIG